MAKRKVIRKSNKPLTFNIYNKGGFMNSSFFQNLMSRAMSNMGGQGGSSGGAGGGGLMGAIGDSVALTGNLIETIGRMRRKDQKPLTDIIGLPSYAYGGNLFAGGGGMNAMGYIGIANTALELAGNAANQAQLTTDTSSAKEGIERYNYTAVEADNYDDLMNDWANRTELQHVGWKDLRNKTLAEDVGNSFTASAKGFTAGSAAGPWGAAIGGIVGGLSSVIGSVIGRKKAKKEAKKINKQIDIANARNLRAYEDQASNIESQNDINTMATFAAYGGPLGMWGNYGSGAIGYELAKEYLDMKTLDALNRGKITSLPNSATNTFSKGGKIHIKPENRGKFTKYCGGKVTSECIARGKRSSDPAVRKRATFAANARKWHHAFGGDLLTHGAEWDNGLRIIGNGGTHEENPMEGVPMGMDAEGTPNLVEQGEVIFNDYVFSNRMFADGGLLESFNLPKSYDGYSFAAIAEKLGEESKERPNDPISKRGLLSSMSRLQQAQETVRQQNQVGQKGVQYAHGGRMGTLFDGPGDMPNFLDGVDYGDWQDYGTLLEPIDAEDLYEKFLADSNRGTKGSKLTWLRYAPVVGAAIGLGQNIFSKPDYSNADTILAAANQAGNYTPVSYDPIGNYLQYRPLDRNYYINKLNAQAGATRRAIMNTTSPSRDAALLAADYNAQGRLGDLARQAEEYNLAQRQAVETFNRGTNMANTEMGLRAAMANQEAALKARSAKLRGVAQAMAMRDAIDARRGESMSANLTNFFNSLEDIGREEYSRNMNNSNPATYYTIDRNGNISYKKDFYNLPPEEQKAIRFKAINEAGMKLKKESKAKGGYLTIKRGGKNG